MTIDNAKKRNINDMTDLPDLSSPVQLFFQKMKIDIISKEQIDGYTQETKKCVLTEGTIQPMGAEKLAIKPEGERSWKNSTLHCLPNVKLKHDDIVKIRHVHYRVTGITDYDAYGYNEFDLLETYRE